MATRKPAAPDLRPLFDVEVKDSLAVYKAISDGLLPASVAPISIDAARRWAHNELTESSKAYGLEIKRRGLKP
jgi:hypothetical protein